MSETRRALIGALAAWPALPVATALAQRPRKTRRIAVVFLASPADEMTGPDPADPFARAFVHALRDLGLVDGRNIVVERRSAEGHFERLPALMQEVVALDVDVIVTFGPGVQEAQRVTDRIPIVGLIAGALDARLAASLARPGGNLTGFGHNFTGFHGKQLQLLMEAAPATSRVAVISRSQPPGPRAGWREQIDAAARALQLEARWVTVDEPERIEAAFAGIVRERANAIFLAIVFNFTQLRRIADFAIRQRLPSFHDFREYVEAGGLLSYGTSRLDDVRRTAAYVKKILDGAKPADLPFEQPTRFEMVINLKTARAIGITIPQSLLLRADEVIE